MFDNSHLLASDWVSFTSKKGRLVVYDIDHHTMKIYEVDAGPADITYDRSSQLIYISANDDKQPAHSRHEKPSAEINT
jgi:hypothetical protein